MILLSRGNAEQVFAQVLTRRLLMAEFEDFLYEIYSFGLNARLGADKAICACAVLNRNGLPKKRLHLLGHDTGHGVCPATGAERDNHLDGAVRK